jgi:hypothetical protein
VLEFSQTLQREPLTDGYIPSFMGFFDKIRIIATTRGQKQSLILFFYGWVQELLWTPIGSCGQSKLGSWITPLQRDAQFLKPRTRPCSLLSPRTTPFRGSRTTSFCGPRFGITSKQGKNRACYGELPTVQLPSICGGGKSPPLWC